MKSAKSFLGQSMLSLRGLGFSHKFFLIMILFNVILWSDLFEPQSSKVTTSSLSFELVCDNSEWTTPRSAHEFFARFSESSVGAISSSKTERSKSKKIDSNFKKSLVLEDEVSSLEINDIALPNRNNNDLLGFSLRGPPIHTV